MGEEQKWPDRLTPVQQAVVDCVRENPGRFIRSNLAKLLVGSKSSRLEDLVEHLDYGRLARYSRKSVTIDIDILMDQGYLTEDPSGGLVFAKSKRSKR